MIPSTTNQNISSGRLVYQNGDVYQGDLWNIWSDEQMYHHFLMVEESNNSKMGEYSKELLCLGP